MKFRQPYAYDTDAASLESGLECRDESLAVQSEKDDADINVIMYRFGKTGQLPQTNKQPLDPDIFHEITDYQSALNAVNQAQEAFMLIPAEIREKFNNNPHEYLLYITDPDTPKEKLKELGVLRPDHPLNAPQEHDDVGAGTAPTKP